MTCFTDAFKNQRTTMTMKNVLLGGRLAIVVGATTTLIEMGSGKSFKAVANDF